MVKALDKAVLTNAMLVALKQSFDSLTWQTWKECFLNLSFMRTRACCYGNFPSIIPSIMNHQFMLMSTDTLL